MSTRKHSHGGHSCCGAQAPPGAPPSPEEAGQAGRVDEIPVSKHSSHTGEHANPTAVEHGSAHIKHDCHHAASVNKPLVEVPSDTVYTCPMHPEVRQVGPGTCPICGMALEPLMPSDTEDEHELYSVRRRFWISAALSLPLVAIAMLPHLLDLHLSTGLARALRWTEILLST